MAHVTATFQTVPNLHISGDLIEFDAEHIEIMEHGETVFSTLHSPFPPDPVTDAGEPDHFDEYLAFADVLDEMLDGEMPLQIREIAYGPSGVPDGRVDWNNGLIADLWRHRDDRPPARRIGPSGTRFGPFDEVNTWRLPVFVAVRQMRETSDNRYATAEEGIAAQILAGDAWQMKHQILPAWSGVRFSRSPDGADGFRWSVKSSRLGLLFSLMRNDETDGRWKTYREIMATRS